MRAPFKKPISFIIPAVPMPKERPRRGLIVDRSNRKRFVHYTPAKTKEYEATIRQCAKLYWRGPPTKWPVKITITVVLPIPASWPRWKKDAAIDGMVMPTQKPDADNVAKAICDGLNRIVYTDDSALTTVSIHKRFIRIDEMPFANVVIEEQPKIPCSIKRKKDFIELSNLIQAHDQGGSFL